MEKLDTFFSDLIRPYKIKVKYYFLLSPFYIWVDVVVWRNGTEDSDPDPLKKKLDPKHFADGVRWRLNLFNPSPEEKWFPWHSQLRLILFMCFYYGSNIFNQADRICNQAGNILPCNWQRVNKHNYCFKSVKLLGRQMLILKLPSEFVPCKLLSE